MGINFIFLIQIVATFMRESKHDQKNL